MKKNIKIYSNKGFAKRMRTLMGESALTLEDLANLTGRAISTASTWRRGRLPRKESDLEILANAFGVSKKFLITGEDDLSLIFSNTKDNLESPQKKEKHKLCALFYEILERADKIEGGIKKLSKELKKISHSLYGFKK